MFPCCNFSELEILDEDGMPTEKFLKENFPEGTTAFKQEDKSDIGIYHFNKTGKYFLKLMLRFPDGTEKDTCSCPCHCPNSRIMH